MLKRCGGMFMGAGLSAGLPATLAACVSLCGCGVGGAARAPSERALRDAEWLAFQPLSVRISPLTRLEPGPDGEPRLVLYFELLDTYGHSTKGLGSLRVELSRGSRDIQESERTWLSDMLDPDDNSLFFDVTGLYRVPLVDPPAWLVTPDDGPGVYRIAVYFTTRGPDGDVIYPRDELTRLLDER